MSPNARAEALEHYMIEQLNSSAGSTDEADNVKLDFYDPERPVPRGAGRLFAEKPMPAEPTALAWIPTEPFGPNIRVSAVA